MKFNEEKNDENIEKKVESTEEIIEESLEQETKTEINIEKQLRNQNLKLLADMENLRKRFELEKSVFIKYSSSGFLSEILPTIDMFEMALHSEVSSEEVKNWLKGFEMIYANFISILEREGVKKIEVKPGEDFDHNFHHALEEVETDEIEEGKIYQVVTKGYLLHDRLLRPATVKIAKKKQENKLDQEEKK